MHTQIKPKLPLRNICSILCFFLLLSLPASNIYKADVSGQCSAHQTGTTCPGHRHSWETPSTCGTCNGTTTVSITCNTCKGKGYTPNSLLGTTNAAKSSSIKACTCGWKGTTSDIHYCLRLQACSNCGGSGYIFYYASSQFNTSNFTSAATKGSSTNYSRGSGSTSGTCSNCYSSGTYKGKNTRCTRSGCSKHSYAPWSDYLNGTGTCYTDSCTPVYGNHESNNVSQYNSTHHWSNCLYCGGTMHTTSHSFGNEWTSGGYRYQSCACGYSKNNGATTYYISYHGNGATGGNTATSTHTYHSTSNLNPNGFYRTGYTFMGWSTNSSATSPTYNNGQSISNLTTTHGATIHLYALWTPNAYTISFHPNGGSTPALTSVTAIYNTSNYYSHGGIIPSRTGYTFLGWYTSTTGGKQVYGANGVCVNNTGYWSQNTWVYPDNITLYAHWERNVYTVNYNGNGGTVTYASKTNYYNEAVDLTGVRATKSGYVFTGWNTSPNAKTPLPSYLMPDGNLTLYAIYSIPVSDISGVYLVAWPYGSPSMVRSIALSKTYAQELKYTYSGSNINLSTLTGSTSNSYAIVAYDYAGNKSILFQSDPPPPLDYYLQTVHHYFYHPGLDNWIWFDTTSSLKLIGENFSPTYLTTIPSGYQKDSIDSSYIVTGDKTSFAYYKPSSYQITFDPNGGTVSPKTKNVYYLDFYGDLPIPQRTGHQFLGWYTQKNGGNRITSSSVYETSANTTLYAHWEVNSHIVIYDYWTNGGDSVSLESSKKNYGDAVNLSITATKLGWSFIGWNTNPDATTSLNSLELDDEDITLYAIYKKDITATFVDSDQKNKRQTTITIYNRETNCNMPMLTLTPLTGWTALGWSLDTASNATIHAAAGTDYSLTDSTTFYGCYSQSLSISYDTNGSNEEIPSETKERLFNASGSYKNPLFTLANQPHLNKHSFVHWEALDSSGNFFAFYNPQEIIPVTQNLTFVARWNQHPEIEAYNRYFTLDNARNGEITQEKLFEKVVVTDKEDGILVNGIDVTIPKFDSYDFKNNSSFLLTYEAKDSFGNVVRKSITVYVVDTTVTPSPLSYYPRFISNTFFTHGDHLLLNDYGGLEALSLWRTSETYRTLLKESLEKETPSITIEYSHEEIELIKNTLP